MARWKARVEFLLSVIGLLFISLWRRGVVVSVIRRMNEVTLRRARLVLALVTVFGGIYHHGT